MINKLEIICVTAVLLMNGAAGAQGRYGDWQGGGDIQQLVEKLRKLTAEAEKARAADRRFLGDLWDLIDQYDNPWTQTLISDNFRDGDFTRDPRWILASGDVRVDDRLGLVSDVRAVNTPAAAEQPSPGEASADRGADLAIALLGSLLNETRKGKKEAVDPAPAPATRTDEAATLYINERIPDGFSLSIQLHSLDPDGQYIIEIYRDRPGGDGYAVVFRPGDARPFELLRTSRDRTAVVETATATAPRGEFALAWHRKPGGEMSISVDGKRLFKVEDRTWKGGFKGLSLNTLRGRFAVRSIAVLGAGS